MRTGKREINRGSREWRNWSVLLGCAVLFLTAVAASAVVPLPDQIFYGTIAIQNKAVTNNTAGTNVLIEARRASDGALLASYRMGTTTTQGKLFYALRVPMEDAPASDPTLGQPGDPIVLTVKKLNVVQFTSTNIPIESGYALRLDFGSTVDLNGDGVPDGWEAQYFGTQTNNLLGDSDHDGISDWAEYVAGTSPLDTNDVLHVYSQHTGNQLQISFHTITADGIGYEGRTRYYALEAATNFGAANSWQNITNYSRIKGTNQTVIYNPIGTPTPVFFRARVWLEGP
jgi:hypothetical protein